ncbi:myosin-7B [Gasterosteus aculeatus]
MDCHRLRAGLSSLHLSHCKVSQHKIGGEEEKTAAALQAASQLHEENLSELMTDLRSSRPHSVRCVIRDEIRHGESKCYRVLMVFGQQESCAEAAVLVGTDHSQHESGLTKSEALMINAVEPTRPG